MRNIRERLVRHIQHLEDLESQKRDAGEALKEAFSAAAAEGFDRATLRVVLKLRQLSPSERRQRRALEAIYLASLGMLDGDALPEEARRRLDPAPPPPPPPGPSASPEASDSPAPGKGEAKKPKPAQVPLVLKEPAEALKEGRTAGETGMRIYDNPYPAGDPCRAAWDEGWCQAKRSHGMDTPEAYQRRKPAESDEPTEAGK